jgi:DNA-binding transcriptional ArsR family regulator
MNKRDEWVKCPSKWIIDENGLRNFATDAIAANAIALMCLTIITHRSNSETGLAKITYDDFQSITGKSRSIVSRGLKVLVYQGLIASSSERSAYQLTNYDPKNGWCKLPCKALYQAEKIPFFYDFNLRQRAELDALKLMFLFAAFRDNDSNVAVISYEKIIERTGISRDRIKRATGVLAAGGVVYPENMPSSKSEYGVALGYRIAGIDSRRHQGTLGRTLAGF